MNKRNLIIGGVILLVLLGSIGFMFIITLMQTSAPENQDRAEPTNTLEPTDEPTNTPQPLKTLEQTEIPQLTDTPFPTQEPTITPPLLTTQLPTLPFAAIMGSQADIRSGPGADYPIKQTLGKGATASATGFDSGRSWIQIELPDGTSGWVASDLVLVEIQIPEGINTVTPTASVTTAAQGEDGSSSGSAENPVQCVGGCAMPPGPSCAIRADIDSSGDRIYYVPGDSRYDETDIKPEEGDRWFCTEEEAQEAGFSRSIR